MSLWVNNNQKDFEMPEVGIHAAVCSHVVDVGIQETMYGTKDKLAVVWELADKMSNGKPFQLAKLYTKSLHEKSSLRNDLQAWRGKAFSDQELTGFDMEKLVGAPCYLNIISVEKGDKQYPSVAAVAKLPQGITAPKPSGEPAPKWILKMIRNDVGQSAATPATPIEEELLPF